MSPLLQNLTELAGRVLPRMLTQVSRDPNSSTFGCWDRNWWHYKIRDFPSVILQQGGYAMHVATEVRALPRADHDFLQSLASASATFWNQRAKRYGAFEEYYPYEQGYPPLAFSSLAIAKLVNQGTVGIAQVRPGLEIASRQLLNRFEAQAANQQIAGTAALAVIRKIAPETVDRAPFEKLLNRSLALQHEDGWFPEYDGPDLGYLSVTMDCLWDIHDATGDERCLSALHKALDFLAWFALEEPGHAGMHNSRNTDYIVPYGIARMAVQEGPRQELAAAVLHRWFENASHSDHVLASVDDRYWCHYIGHSLFRAVRELEKNPVLLPHESKHQSLPPAIRSTGHHRFAHESMHVLVSAMKGGIITATVGEALVANDFGWIVQRGTKQWVSHWWTKDWNVESSAGMLRITGPMICHTEHLSSPFKHIILRCLSFVLKRRMIGMLKNLLIFSKGTKSLHFERTIQFQQNGILIRDRITGILPTDTITRAPRSSKRHVASADSFHPEDKVIAGSCWQEESRITNSDMLTIESRIPLPENI